jgi:hypothetical protein
MPWGAVAAAVVGAVASSESSKKSAKATEEAARVQAAATEKAAAGERSQFEQSQAQAEPFRQAGLGALEQQQALLGLSGSSAQQQAFDQFQQSPGQAFLQQRGQQALLRNSAAVGGLGGGQVRSELQQQGIGFAQQDLQNQLARLGSIAGQGQAITGNVANLGANTAGQIGQFGIQGAQAQASGILGARQIQAQQEAQTTGVVTSGLAGGAAGSQTEGSSFGEGATAGIIGKL